MNLQELHAGESYAYQYDRGRGVFHMNATKVRLIKTYKKVVGYNERATSFAEVEKEDGRRVDVRVRDLIDFWDEYEARRDTIRRQKEQTRLQQKARDAYREFLNEVYANYLRKKGVEVITVSQVHTMYPKGTVAHLSIRIPEDDVTVQTEEEFTRDYLARLESAGTAGTS